MNIKPADCSHTESSEFHREKKYEESALHHTTIILTNSPGYCTSHLHAVTISWSMHPFLSISLCLCVSLYLSGFLLLWCHTCESLLIMHLVPVGSLRAIYSKHQVVAPHVTPTDVKEGTCARQRGQIKVSESKVRRKIALEETE